MPGSAGVLWWDSSTLCLPGTAPANHTFCLSLTKYSFFVGKQGVMGSVLLRRMSKYTKYVETTTKVVTHEVCTSLARARSSPGLWGLQLMGCGWRPPCSHLHLPQEMLHILLFCREELASLFPSCLLFPQAQKLPFCWNVSSAAKLSKNLALGEKGEFLEFLTPT